MFIEGSLKSGKTSFLIQKFTELIKSGVLSSQIFVLTQNSHKKTLFTQKAKEILRESNLTGFAELPVYTFNGIVYNKILENWPLVEAIIPEKFGKRELLPCLSGLETTEYFLKRCIEKINKKAKIEETLRDYRSYKNLKHQILRRLTLITNNNLSKTEINERSLILRETMGAQVNEVLEELKLFSARYRTFDYLRQSSIFLYLLDSNKINFDYISYLLIDDYDELTYTAQYFVEKIIPQAKDFYIAADTKGGSRRGYLCANPQGYEQLKIEYKDKVKILNSKRALEKDAETLFNRILVNDKKPYEKITLVENTIRHVEMLEQVFCRIKFLINTQKLMPDDIVIVVPSFEGAIKLAFQEFLKKENLDYQFLMGSKKIIDNPLVFGTLIILQLVNSHWKLMPKEFEIRSMLTGLLNIPTAFCQNILEDYSKKGFLSTDSIIKDEKTRDKFLNLINLIDNLRQGHLSLLEQVEKIFSAIIIEIIQEDTDFEAFNLMLKSLNDFETFIKKSELNKNKNLYQRDWIIQVKDTIVSDNPSYSIELKENHIKLATPQKVIDMELSSKIQIWMDVSSDSWKKEDTGTLYNAWVFNKNWNRPEYTPEVHNKLTLKKTAHILRKLCLLAEDNIYCYACQLDASGADNNDGIIDFLISTELSPEEREVKFKFTPRKDQAPVLEYKSGNMAISAVPGAGKTKILEALIIKMIQEGINPEELLILTYMDSAARNIKERIKNSCPNLTKFPNISTIHGLGLSIIKHGENYSKLGLESDFEICDDTAKYKIMTEVFYKASLENIRYDDFIRIYPNALSQAKLLDISAEKIGKFLSNKSPDLYSELYSFFPVYTEYQNTLKQKNMIDFDDLLIYSVKLLKNFPDIRKYYQDKFQFIIEDEAQDSSFIQQELLSMLSEKHNNLIRCGDPNQAITSSFSSSDSNSFVDFIRTTPNIVMMTHSQRCAKEIYELANNLLNWAEDDIFFKGAFIRQNMAAVEGKNPDLENSLDFKIYETSEEEQDKIIKEISRLKKQGYKNTIGVLLRTNSSVSSWAYKLDKANLQYICYSESIEQKKVFKFIKTFLEFINNPWDNKLVKNLYEEFCKNGILEYKFESFHLLEKIYSPFISFAKSQLPEPNLHIFQQEILKWLTKSILPPDELISLLGMEYFENVIDKSNARILSILAARYRNAFTNNDTNNVVSLPDIIQHFNELGSKKKLSGIKFFDELEKDEEKYDYVQVMTTHKAKGLEFDVVFMPEMQEAMYSYPVNPDIIKISEGDRLINQIKEIIKLNKSIEKIKLEQIQEHLRLIYVGITRARKYLYMSGHEKAKYKWQKDKEYQPSYVLQYLINNYQGVKR